MHFKHVPLVNGSYWRNCVEQWFPNFLVPRTSFVEDNFSIDWWWWGYHISIIITVPPPQIPREMPPLQYSGLENSMGCIVHGVVKSWTGLSGFHSFVHSTSDHQALCPGGWGPLVAQMVKHLPTMWETGFDAWVRKILWGRKRQPTPILLPGKSRGWRSLVGYSPWGRKESDMTERLHFTSSLHFSVEGKLSAGE